MYFSYDPENGIRFHKTAKEAQSMALASLETYSQISIDDGWPENTDEICWGRVEESVQVTQVEYRPPPEELDEDGCDEEGTYWSGDIEAYEKRELCGIAKFVESPSGSNSSEANT